MGIQTHLNLSQITKGLVQKTGFFVLFTRRDVSQTFRVHNVLENPNIGPTDSLNCFRLQGKFPQNSFSNVSTIYPNIGSGGPPNIPGRKGALQKTSLTRDGFYSHLFLVPKKGGSVCLVIDLSSLNKFIVNEYFRMENLSCLKTLLLLGDFMTNVDLKDAYLSVPVHESSQKFFCFIWKGTCYQFKALSFGLYSTPRILRKF